MDKDIPVSVATLGKRTKKPVYGQITDITEPRQNTNDPNKWNLHFIRHGRETNTVLGLCDRNRNQRDECKLRNRGILPLLGRFYHTG